MSDSWDYGQGALAFFERLRSVVAKEDLPAYLHEAFERRQTEQNRNVCDAAVAAKEDDARSNEIHAFVKATFGDVTRDETAFFYNTIREEFRRGGDRFVGYLTKLEEYTRRFFGFQGNYHLGEFMFLGITGVRKMRRAESIWTWIVFAWLVMLGLAKVALSISLYSYANTPFETVALSLVIFLYASILTARQQLRLTALELQRTVIAAAIESKAHLGRTAKDEEKHLSGLKLPTQWATIRLFGNRATSFMLSAVALWHLLGLLWSA